ncbi:MAG: Rieske 2Fe-2S domain-containing protein [Phycisphaerales bacterium JB039]
MSARYTWVQWNRHKRIYDAVAAAGVALYLLVFIGAGSALYSGDHALSAPILLMRALGTCAIILLHIVLAIGPLHRLDDRFAPLLYNRRHLGVMTFCVALAHGGLAVLFYGAFGRANPLLAVLGGYDFTGPIWSWPFEIFGFGALVILFLMAATSHDFWLKNLSPRWWKWLHMSVYIAYGLLVIHVSLGALQSERSLLYPLLMLAGAVMLMALHIGAGLKEARRDAGALDLNNEWIDACAIDDIPEDRAAVICLKGRQRVAIFRHNGAISAISNVCAHQGGPLGEGKIIDGCVTCPWHGYQYLPHNGQSPPPYTEKIPTYEVRLRGRRILLNPEPRAPGTPVEPARFAPPAAQSGRRDAEPDKEPPDG